MMNDQASEGEERSEAGSVALVDVILNLFAILIVFLMMMTFSETREPRLAPTHSPQDPEMISVRSCYIDTFRPRSQMAYYRNGRIELLDMDVASSNLFYDVSTDGDQSNPYFSLQDFADQNDGNTYSAVYHGSELESSLEIAAPPLSRDENFNFLQERVFSLGESVVIFVSVDETSSFSELYDLLLERGARFRWQYVLRNRDIRFSRHSAMFGNGEFCR